MIFASSCRFDLFQFWKQFWSEPLPGTLPEVTTWTSECQLVFLQSCRHALRAPQSATIALCALTIYDSFDSFMALPPYGLVWLLDCCRLLTKASCPMPELPKQLISKLPKRLMPGCRLYSTYKFRIAAGLLRVDCLSLADTIELASSTDCQTILQNCVGETRIIPPAELLGLISNSVVPSARIFLLRLLIHHARNVFQTGIVPTHLAPLIPWDAWQGSLGLIALFNDHETLLYRMLLLLLRIEECHPIIVLPVAHQFCAVQMYCDMLLRAGHNVEEVCNTMLENTTALEYYTVFYRLVRDGLLFNTDQLDELLSFHADLSKKLNIYTHLTPLTALLNALT
ncbi:hypothetical protein PSACC_02915 [Paramicrosporidium saccamoebae]|uniref:Uncharacterized protein n=1 Tax=Paramicrosporidium saccamoebae TaxID=1246581 RepID=A0A2H9THS8_9FUNG|nr:hypothetical protein PSACC_02915 [Paramicrosporidium saccamoebae]